MENRKGLGNSVFALITSASLITGLTLLSMTSSPYSIAANTTQNQSMAPDMSNVSLPENTSVNASNYVNREQAQNLASKNPDLITSIAKKLFEIMSGQQLQPPQPGNTSLGGNNTTGNMTGPEGNITAPSNTTDNSTTGNETEPEMPPGYPSNATEPDNTTEPQENTTNNQSNPERPDGNNTFNNTFDDFNQTGGNKTAENLGFLQQIAKTFSQLFTGGETGAENQTGENQSSTTSDNQSSPEPEQPQNPENPDQNGSQSDNDEKQQENTESSILSKIPVLPLAGFLAVALLALMYYRSDKDGGEFLKTLLNRLKAAITSIPDLFRRSVVNTVSFLIDRTKGIAAFMNEMMHKPVETVAVIKERAKNKLTAIKNWLGSVRNRSIKDNLKIALKGGETQSYEGMDQIWHNLKKKLKLENNNTVTPAEVRAEAIKQNLPDHTVDEIVDAFRREKYSSQGYPGDLEISKWNKDLEGDEN